MMTSSSTVSSASFSAGPRVWLFEAWPQNVIAFSGFGCWTAAASSSTPSCQRLTGMPEAFISSCEANRPCRYL